MGRERRHDQGGLHDWKDKQNDLGADIEINRIYEFSDDMEADRIIRHDHGVEVGGTLNVVISLGRNILLKNYDKDEDPILLTFEDMANGSGEYATEENARKLAEKNDITYEIVYVHQAGKANGQIINAYRTDGETLKAGTYLPQSVTLKIVVNDDNQ